MQYIVIHCNTYCFALPNSYFHSHLFPPIRPSRRRHRVVAINVSPVAPSPSPPVAIAAIVAIIINFVARRAIAVVAHRAVAIIVDFVARRAVAIVSSPSTCRPSRRRHRCRRPLP
jgi:hypothetical protein